MTPHSDSTKTVIVFRGHLLPYSETFIRAQTLALKRWRPILVGEAFLTSGLALDGIDVRLPFPSTFLRWHRAAFRALKRIGLLYPPVTAQLRSYGAHLVHAHFGPSAVDIWPYAEAIGLPMVVTLHGYDINIDSLWWESGQGGRRMRRYPQELLALSNKKGVRFLAASKAILERAVDFGIPRERIALSYIGIELTQFAPGSVPIEMRPHRVLYVGRFVENKGVTYLIEAIAGVSKSVPNVELVLVGEGPLRATLEAQSAALGARVVFKGALRTDLVRREMAEARVLCLPSVTIANGNSEGLGLVLVEAQAAGLPALSSARGGAYEVVQHEVSGYRFPERDVETLTLQLQRLLSDDALLISMSRAAVENARRFDIHRCISTVEEQYEELLRATR